MELPGHPDYEPQVSTPSGEDGGTSVANVNPKEVFPSIGPGITFRQRYMWSSKKHASRQISLNLSFPGPVELTAIMVHSQHSGKFNEAKAVRIEARTGPDYRLAKSTPLSSSDELVTFPATTAKEWRLSFQANQSQKVCLRGLQYFSGTTQLFPPRAPYKWRETIGVDLPAFPRPNPDRN